MAHTRKTISKADFLSALSCPTMGWLDMRSGSGGDEDYVAGSFTAAELMRMTEGREVHDKAQSLHPNGVFAGSKDRTNELVLKRAKVIFEAAFGVDLQLQRGAGSFVARADWIRRVRSGWVVGEIKSSLHDEDKGPSDEHLDDMAYTVMVLKAAGLPIKGAEIVLMNRDWRLSMADEELFVVTDQTADVFRRATEFESVREKVSRKLLAPRRPRAKLCWSCKGCAHFEEDCVGKDLDNPLFVLPRLRETKFNTLNEMGVTEVGDIPGDFELTDAQELVRTAINTGQPQINAAALQEEMNAIRWPAGHLDFETVKSAIPLYEGIAPHAQIVTQYSLHVQKRMNAKPVHAEFLADHTRDCRRELAEQLLEDTSSCGTIFSYSSFEKTTIRGLAKLFPDLQTPLEELEEKLFDLEPIVRKHYVHPGFRGRSSIKVVLPVLVPELSGEDGYKGLAVNKGDDAVAHFWKLARGEYDEEQAQKVRADLLAYCKLDTMAMVKVLGALAE